jgi:hypothetical protein
VAIAHELNQVKLVPAGFNMRQLEALFVERPAGVREREAGRTDWL